MSYRLALYALSANFGALGMGPIVCFFFLRYILFVLIHIFALNFV